VSIIIPAHNEANVLSRTLDAVARQDYAGDLQTIVVANGCTDDTALISRRYEEGARRRRHLTIELDPSGKPAALNAGDAAADGAIRVYLDADITISPSTVSELVTALERPSIQFAVPALRIGRSKSWFVRSYLTVWSQMPYVQAGGSGGGVYAVSASGRARWNDYPSIYSDDSFARLHFSDAEIAVVDSATGTVWFPDTVREMVAVRARVFQGVWELRREYPGLDSATSGNARAAVRQIAREPRLWLRAPAFFAVYVLGFRTARRRARRGDGTWARAESSRLR
jgi:glycosyltransferase involved in cell wall biosynthesis